MSKCLLLSGGADSIALCYSLRPDLALTIDYGQAPSAAEIDASEAVCSELGIRHKVLKANCSDAGAGCMLNDGKRRPPVGVSPTPEWWPFRNQLLLTLGAAVCVIAGIE